MCRVWCVSTCVCAVVPNGCSPRAPQRTCGETAYAFEGLYATQAKTLLLGWRLAACERSARWPLCIGLKLPAKSTCAFSPRSSCSSSRAPSTRGRMAVCAARRRGARPRPPSTQRHGRSTHSSALASSHLPAGRREGREGGGEAAVPRSGCAAPRHGSAILFSVGPGGCYPLEPRWRYAPTVGACGVVGCRRVRRGGLHHGAGCTSRRDRLALRPEEERGGTEQQRGPACGNSGVAPPQRRGQSGGTGAQQQRREQQQQHGAAQCTLRHGAAAQRGEQTLHLPRVRARRVRVRARWVRFRAMRARVRVR